MQAKEIRNRDQKELQELLLNSRKRLSDMKFDVSAKKLKNIKELSLLKKEIARILTVINEKNG